MSFRKFFGFLSTMVLAAFASLNPTLEAQNPTVYGSVDGKIGYNLNNAGKPVAIPAGNGVIASGAWVTAAGNQFKEGTSNQAFAVSGKPAPNAAETLAMNSVVDVAINKLG